jgi:hypothetical protein
MPIRVNLDRVLVQRRILSFEPGPPDDPGADEGSG